MSAKTAIGKTAGLGILGMLGMSPEEAEAYLTKKMLKEALEAGIDNFRPMGGASLTTGPFDRGEGAKGANNLFAILTGENPNAVRLADEANKERTLQLGESLIDEFGEDAVTLVKGMYDHPERSFIVEGQSPLRMAQIGKDYGQESVFTDRGLIYTSGENAGKMNPIKPQDGGDYRGVLNSDAENYYTEARSSGKPEIGIPPRSEKVQYDIDWDTYEDIPEISGANNPASAKGIHYSTTPNLTEIDPSYYGTGSAGAERVRVEDGAPNRSMFYLGDENLVPESIVKSKAPNKYIAELQNMYDSATDPESLNRFSKNPTEFEKSLQAKGYEGYLSESMADPALGRTGTAVKFTPTAVAGSLAVSSMANGQVISPDQAKEMGMDFSTYTQYKKMMDYLQEDLGDSADNLPPMSQGSIEAADLPFMQTGANALRSVEFPWGRPFESTANAMDRWAYGEDADMLDKGMGLLEVGSLGGLGLIKKPAKYALGGILAALGL